TEDSEDHRRLQLTRTTHVIIPWFFLIVGSTPTLELNVTVLFAFQRTRAFLLFVFVVTICDLYKIHIKRDLHTTIFKDLIQGSLARVGFLSLRGSVGFFLLLPLFRFVAFSFHGGVLFMAATCTDGGPKK